MFRTDDLGLLAGLIRFRSDGVELGTGESRVFLDLRSGVLVRPGADGLPLSTITGLTASGDESSSRFRVVGEQGALPPVVLLEADGFLSNTEVSRLVERLAWLLSVPFTRPTALGKKPDVYLYKGIDKFFAFFISLDALIATGVAIFGRRGSFLRFCALQRLISLAAYDIPLSALLVTVAAVEIAGGKPGEQVVAWGALVVLLPLLGVVILRFAAAAAAAHGQIYLVPGLKRVVRRWLPTELPPTSDPTWHVAATAVAAPAAVSVGAPAMQPPPPPRPYASVPLFVWVLVFLVLVPFGGCISWLGYAIAVGPDPEAKPGSQTPKRFIETIRSRGLLSPTETPTYFYSDGLTDITDGMYFFTDQKLVAYSSSWDPPAVIVPLGTITRIDFTRATSWPDNSTITVEHSGVGGWLQIPVATDRDGDRHFYEALHKAWKKAVP